VSPSLPDPRTDPGPGRALRLLLVAALLHGLTYLLLLPPWMGEDEPWQLEYAHHVAAGGLPGRGWEFTYADVQDRPLSQLFVLRRFDGADPERVARYQRAVIASLDEHRFPERVDFVQRHADPPSFDEVSVEFSAVHQPPLYFALLGWLLRPFGELEPSLELRLARVPSLLCYLAVVALGLALARLAFDDPSARLLAGAIVAWLPLHARQAAVVNNDVLAKVVVAGVLLLAARLVTGRSRLRVVIPIVVLCGLGLVVKTTTAGGLGVAALALLLRADLGSDARGGALARVGALVRRAGPALLVLAALAAAAVAVWLRFHNPALPKNVDAFLLRVRNGISWRATLELWGTSAGASNWQTRLMPAAAYVGFGAFAAASLVGALAAAVRRIPWVSRRVLLLCLAAVALQYGLLVLRGVAVGRYWIPVLPAWGVAAAAGLTAGVPERWRPRVAALCVLLLVVHAGWFLWGTLVVNQYAVWGS